MNCLHHSWFESCQPKCGWCLDRVDRYLAGLNGLGRTQLELGDLVSARRLMAQSRKHFEALASKEGRLIVILNQALLTFREGEVRRALHMVETLQTLAGEWQTPLKRRARLELENLEAAIKAALT